MLENSLRTIADTEDVALGITDELGRNREKIDSARSKVMQIDGLAGTAKGILKSMTSREGRQKRVMYGVMAMIMAGIVAVLWSMGA